MSSGSTSEDVTVGSGRDATAGPGRAASRLRLILGLGLAACVGYFAVELYLLSGELGLPLDDSWIHLQFARNLARGGGLSINPGELLPGSTAPLWTALVSCLFWLPGGPLVWVKLAGALLFVGVGAATHRLALELELTAGWAELAAGLTLATSWLVWSALSGLEILLFTLLSLWGMVHHLRERREPDRLPLALPILALGALARPEGLLLLLAAIADGCLIFDRTAAGALRWRPPRLRSLGLAIVVVGLLILPMLGFNAWVSGSLLPTTFAAKSTGWSRWLPEMGYLYTVFGIFFQAQPWMALFAGAGVLTLLGRLGSRRRPGLLPAMWLLGLPCAYGLIDPPGSFSLVGNFGRYFFPLFPVVVVLGALAARDATETLAGRLPAGGWRALWRSLAVALLVVPTLLELVQGAGRYGQSVLNVHDSDVEVARWLAGRLPEEALLAVADIGAIKFLLPNRVVDLAGIANPEIRSWGAERFLDHYRPDYLVIFPEWLRRLVGDDDRFAAVHQVAIEDNITMGGEILAVYATPWTRYALRPVPAAEGGD